MTFVLTAVLVFLPGACSHLSGSHVCSKQIAATISQRSSWGWMTTTRTVYRIEQYCCPGWIDDQQGGCISDCIPEKDVMLTIDSSGSIDENKFELTKVFIKEMIKKFRMNMTGTCVGLTRFDLHAEILLPVGSCNEEQVVLDTVDSITVTQNVTDGNNITAALELLRTQAFANARPNVTDTVFLISAGSSVDESATETQEELANINDIMLIYTIGLLSDAQELERIASTNPRTNQSLTYQVDDFDNLYVNELEEIFAIVVCNDAVSSETTE